MSGLRMICKMYGGMTVTDATGKKVKWIWDYQRDEPRLESEMKAEEKAASERAKWLKAKNAIEKEKQIKMEF